MELLGLLLPVLIDVVNRRVSNTEVRFWISAGFCILFGVFFNWLDTSFAFANSKEAFESISASITAVFTLAQLSYKTVWEKSPAREDLGLKAEAKELPNQGDPSV